MHEFVYGISLQNGATNITHLIPYINFCPKRDNYANKAMRCSSGLAPRLIWKVIFFKLFC